MHSRSMMDASLVLNILWIRSDQERYNLNIYPLNLNNSYISVIRVIVSNDTTESIQYIPA